MMPSFRSIRRETVICTVPGCVLEAAFLFTGGTEAGKTSRPVLAAYCEQHAEEAAARSGHPWPIAERRPEERIVPARALRAG